MWARLDSNTPANGDFSAAVGAPVGARHAHKRWNLTRLVIDLPSPAGTLLGQLADRARGDAEQFRHLRRGQEPRAGERGHGAHYRQDILGGRALSTPQLIYSLDR